jgi:dTDP-4-amino-4,6-dideoxygalactose transaminase
MGKYVEQFENALSNYLGREAVCVTTGTAALHLALQAVGLKTGDEVLVQSLTYVATFQAISATGATAIACEVLPNTLTIDLEDAKTKLSPKTKAIMPVHYGSGVGDLDEIYKFASINKLRVIEDAAHAFGTRYKGKLVGSFGDISCFSFDGIKNITSGEGGLVVSGDKKILEKIKDARLLGVEKDTEKRYSGQRSWEFDVSEQGWRFHMSNIMAAIGIEQFKKLDTFASRRKKIAIQYQTSLNQITEVELLEHNYNDIVPHIFVILVPKKERQLLRDYLNTAGIQTGVHYLPNHLLTKYKTEQILETTENIYSRIVTLPLHLDLSDLDVQFTCDMVRDFFIGKK